MRTRILGLWWICQCVAVAVGAAAQVDSAKVTITSAPSSVNVYCDSVYIGMTPCAGVSLPAGRHVITAIAGTPFRWDTRRENRTVELGPDSSVSVHFEFVLDSAVTVRIHGTIEDDILIQPREITLHPALIVGGGLGIVGGIASAYFKMRANAKYDNYIANGNGESLRQTHRLDALAGVTLGLSQLGLAIVAYYLLSE